MDPKRNTMRLISGTAFALTILQWVLRLPSAIAAFSRAGIAGMKGEMIDASMHLVRNMALS